MGDNRRFLLSQLTSPFIFTQLDIKNDGMRWAIIQDFCRLTLLPEAALLVGVEEGVHEVVTVVLGELKRLLLYVLVDTLCKIIRHYTGIRVGDNKGLHSEPSWR